MKRLHVHVSVDDLAVSERFYSALFGQPPAVEKPDYAKWMIEDPQVNFSISTRPNARPGLNHLGVQAETEDELAELHAGLEAASIATVEERGARCCYAHSDKHWATDPSGLVWEMFRSMDQATTYGEDHGVDAATPSAREAPGQESARGCC